MTTPLADAGPIEWAAPPHFAVVFKTYLWDDFVERQARRCAESSRGGDFFLLLDETRGALDPGEFRRIVRTSNTDLLSRGFADRFERGSLIWWNADYPHYHFFELHPEYDYYVFVEYDAFYSGQYASLVKQMAGCEADLAVQPLKISKNAWNWTAPHLRVYPITEMEGCLMCISVISRQGLASLARRRLEMKSEKHVQFWPSAEVFMPTEIKRAGLKNVPLDRFGDTMGFNWRPPQLEQHVLSSRHSAFYHPVYDERRYVDWAIAQGSSFRIFFDPKGPVLQALRRLPLRAYLADLFVGAAQSFFASISYRASVRMWRTGPSLRQRRSV